MLTADTVLGVGMENTHACLQSAAAGELGRSGAQVSTSLKRISTFRSVGATFANLTEGKRMFDYKVYANRALGIDRCTFWSVAFDGTRVSGRDTFFAAI